MKLVESPCGVAYSVSLFCSRTDFLDAVHGYKFFGSFDMENALQCFDSFLTGMEREKRFGTKRERWERERELGRNPELLNVTLGRTAGKNIRGWGRLEAYQCVCADSGEQAGCMNHNRKEK